MPVTKKSKIAIAAIIIAIAVIVLASVLLLRNHSVGTEAASALDQTQAKAEVLPVLNMQESKAVYALPFCEQKNCIDVDIRTIKTQDTWLNGWIANNQAYVIQQQIQLNQKMTLQQAINAYVAKSDAWREKYSNNKAYALYLDSRIASQRNQYVLLQLTVDTQQEELVVKDRAYFFVADRKLQKHLSVLDVIQKKQQTAMHALVQTQYQKWIEQQSTELKKQLPETLYWGQADWFFDGEGIGLHYRANEISKDAPQLDIYFTTAQSKQILQADIYQQMF